MIIVDPVTLGDVACSRASPKWVFDRNGSLVQVPANTLAVTYDPTDLTKAPYADVNLQPVTNLFQDPNLATGWSPSNTTRADNVVMGPDGTMTAGTIGDTSSSSSHYVDRKVLRDASAPYFDGEIITTSVFIKAGTLTAVRLYHYYAVGGSTGANTLFDLSTGTVVSSNCVGASIKALRGGWFRLSITNTVNSSAQYWNQLTSRLLLCGTDYSGNYAGGSGFVYVWGAMLNEGGLSTYTASVQAADAISAGAGLVYSNVPIAEPTYSSSTTYAKDALVYDPATYNVFQSLIASNIGKALTDTSAWTPRGATNRRAMLDQYNNTQTTNADEILMVVSPQAISQGLYLGNVFADEVRISVVDQVEGLVYSEKKSLVELNSGSSFFNWCFKRIKRKDYFLTLGLPPYANALVTISLRKIGGVAKCGMCAIGPTDEFGPTLMGLSTEGKDYSSTTFNFDGTSSTVIRPYAKRMTCDVMVDNDQIDYLQARLFEIRQKPIVWVGGPYGSTAVYGRYESFKNVIQYATRSLMNLTIGGAV